MEVENIISNKIIHSVLVVHIREIIFSGSGEVKL
jgi:hypothetical protein